MKREFRFITILVLILLTAAIFVIPMSAENTAGDIDGDGSVSKNDAEHLLKYLSDWDVNAVGGAVDTNGDGVFNIRDAAQILLYLQHGDEVELQYTGVCYHKGAKIEKKAPGCETDGAIEHWRCRGCRELFADKDCTLTLEEKDLTIPAKGHTEEIDPAVAPGSQTVGYTEGKHCSVCKKVLVKQKAIPGTAFSDPDKYHNDYGYNSLASLTNGSKMQAFYNALDTAAEKFHTDSSIDAADNTVATIDFANFGITLDEAIAVWTTYKNDHPLYYWISSSLNFSDSTLSLLTTDDYAKGSDRASYNDLIYLGVMDYIELIGDDTSSYNIALAFHDAIIIDIDYAYESNGYTPQDDIWAHNVLGVFEKKSGVCESYAKTFQLLLNYCGIDNLIVTGSSNNEEHAWNMAKMDDGNWYWFDLTWDDVPMWMWGIKYNYFCVNDSQNVSWSDAGWGASGASFLQNHACNSSDLGIKHLYPLPERASGTFAGDTPILRDTFTVDGATYAVAGYNTVQLVEYSLPGDLIIPEMISYGGRDYTVISVGCISEDGKFIEGKISREKITSVTIPKTVKFIWDKAFIINSIKEFQVDEANLCFASKDGVLYTKTFHTLIQYPLAAEYTEYSIPEETHYIVFEAFGIYQHSKYLSTLCIGKNIQNAGIVNWGSGYFDPNVSVPGIADKTQFYNFVTGFWGLLKYYLTDSRTVIIAEGNPAYQSDGCAIYNYSKTELLYLNNDPSTANYSIPNSVTSISPFAFSDCDSLTSIKIPDNVVIIETFAFSNCKNLSDLTISENCKYIGNNAFFGCKSLTEVNIPDSVTSIGDGAFYGCSGLNHITISDNCTYIGMQAFEHCEALQSAVIGKGVTRLEPLTFFYCKSLKTITIPDSIISIGNEAFQYCYALTDIYYTGTEEEWAAITIGIENSYLTNATIHYNYVAE